MTSTRDGYCITVHEGSFKRSWRRARFTLAHEAIHALIFNLVRDPLLIGELDCSYAAHRSLERLCDIGASELLAPSHWVRSDIRHLGVGPGALLRLYDRYLVSKEALIWRIADILPRGGVLRWRFHARDGRERRTWRIVRSYPGYERRSQRPWLPNGATLRHASLLSRDLGHGAEPRILPRVRISLNRQSWNGAGIVSVFPERMGKEQPLFDGHRIPDESSRSWDTDMLLFAAEDLSAISAEMPAAGSSL